MRIVTKKFLRRALVAFVAVAALAAVGGCHLFQVFGEPPSAEEIAAYEKLPYYKDGLFQSPEPAPYYPDRVAGSSSWLRLVLPNANAPTVELPKVALDKTSFTTPPAELAAYWLGHSSLIIELEGKRLLVDPVFGNAAPLPGVMRRFTAAPLEREQLPPLDYVLITHDHYDHLEYATMRALRESTAHFIVPYGVAAHLRKWGIPVAQIHEIGWGETFDADGFVIASERTIHFSGRTYGRRDTTLWTSYALKGARHRIFISGDSGYGEHFQDIGAKHGPFDLAFIEIDAWNPGWPRTHLFPEEVIRATRDLGTRALVPVHWGVFDLGRHPWDESIRLIADLAGTERFDLFTPLMGEKLVPGESRTGAWWEKVEEPKKRDAR